MRITQIKRDIKNRYFFYVDYINDFYLTQKELTSLNLHQMVLAVLNGQDESDELDLLLKDETYDLIISEYVLPRGKAYALNLLSARDYSRYGLRAKLVEKGYSDKYIEVIMEYIDSFNYLDDVKYATNYIRQKQASKSLKTIKDELRRKGVSDSDVEIAIANVEEECSLTGTSMMDVSIKNINSVIARKLPGDDINDKGKVTKVIAALLRKGYDYSLVKDCLDKYIPE